MGSWRKYVRERFAESGDSGRADDPVVQELAEHLEDVYAERCATGLGQAQAWREAERQVEDWWKLRQDIEAARQEGAMSERVTKFWMPSFLTLLLGWGTLALLLWARVQPFMTGATGARGLIVYAPWLMVLPLVGALGAYMARSAKARGWRVYGAAAFPAVAAALVFLTVFPWAVLVDRNTGPDFRLVSLAADVFSWVILPGIMLCAGAALQGRAGTREKPRRFAA